LRILQDVPRWTGPNRVHQYLASQLRTKVTSSKQRAVAGALLLLPIYALALWIGGLGAAKQTNPDGGASLAMQADPVLTVIPASNALQAPSAVSAGEADSTDGRLDEAFWEEYDRFAAQKDEPNTEPVASALDPSAALTSKLMVALFVVIGGVYGTQWMLKRFRGGQITSLSGQGMASLQVKESKDLAAGQKLHLVQYGDELLLLGATSQNITLLARYQAEEAATDFSERLAATMEREEVSAAGAVNGQTTGTVDDLPSLEESLARLRQSQSRSMREPHA